MSLRLSLFGNPALAIEGCTVPLRAERRCQLLAALALRGDWVTRDEAATWFWPDHGNADARRNLRKVLHEAAQLPWAVQAQWQGESLRWHVDTDVAACAQRLAAGDVDEALAMAQAPLMCGLDDGGAFGDWVRAQRQQWADRLRSAAASALDTPGLPAGRQLALAQQMLLFDPLDEDAAAAQIEALLRLDRPAEARRVYGELAERMVDTLGVEPAARLRALLQVPSPGLSPAPPAEPLDAVWAFVGREAEKSRLQTLLSQSRTVTVLGPGGIGKSRLVRAALPLLEPAFEAGALWLPLDDLVSVDEVAPRLARLAGMAVQPTAELAGQVLHWLAPRRQLVVLDNAEHLPAVGALAQRWLEAAPGLKLIATSRQPLPQLPGETLRLSGLTLPVAEGSAALAASEAGDLFVRRARAARPGFNPQRHAADIARLLRTVGGMPLAIELAAAWVNLLPVREIAADVEASQDMLRRRDGDGDERPEHRSVEATFEPSWRLLAPAERRALAALSVFAGSFTRTAARALAGTGVALLSSLAERSLLQADPDHRDGRFSLHPLLRQFARARLAEAGDERRDLVARHARHFSERLIASSPDLRGERLGETLHGMDLDLPDILAAWQQALQQRDLATIEKAAPNLMLYFESRGRCADGRRLFALAEAALASGAAPAEAACAALARCQSLMRYREGDLAGAGEVAARGVSLARRCGAKVSLKGSLMNLGLSLWQRGDSAAARPCFDEGLTLARADHDLHGVSVFLSSLASIEHEAGDSAAAEHHYRESLSLCRELHQVRQVATALNNLALLLNDQRRPDEALPLLEEALQLCVRHGIRMLRPNVLFGLGMTRLALGDRVAARELTLQAARAARDGGERLVVAESVLQCARISLAENQIDAAAVHAREGLREALGLGSIPTLLNALACMAECRARAGAVADAVALWSLVQHHPQVIASDREAAQAGISTTRLDDATLAACHARAEGLEPITLAESLLAEPAPIAG